MVEMMPSAATGSTVETAALRDKAIFAREAVMDLASEAKRVAVGKIGEMKTQTADWMSEKKDQASVALRTANDRTVDYVQRNPYKAIAIAAGIGFGLGLLLKRR